MKLIQAITMISQRNTVQPMKMKVIGLFFVILENHFRIQITVKSRAVDRSTIQFCNFLAKGHST